MNLGKGIGRSSYVLQTNITLLPQACISPINPPKSIVDGLQKLTPLQTCPKDHFLSMCCSSLLISKQLPLANDKDLLKSFHFANAAMLF